ncbi:transcriptional regulator with XRE-family HTH domain/tetratricopeptide (TPR) repeat protein [Kribbella aluminosa]|uniref:Transcriptional regulator with XRE-family HTH domain/tetratricopeptide (TPR) repeat protein n=1 Tax=Kribbella aluminosa TaxID=416017 RepID=A0ABS4UG76_9ACTN|nr:XRE family transcriptional regulator [Kribbella aluminosa]MBP2350638.1 transcriptional regulator with XRE-family HTH domain/tetratricopeptide (TPR) repeat protein [Kribbella aluminosa]
MSEPAAPTLSELLRTFRARAGLTQAALAERAGLSEQAISVLERGTRSRPRADTVRALTQALALTPTEADQFRTIARGKLGTPRTPPKDPAADQVPTPWQLPPAAPDFTGRSAQIDAILSVLRDPSAVGLVTITGMGGIGKITLAVHAAHKLADSYPDGHLYLNLRGYGPGEPMTPTDAQRHLLRSLGSDVASIPDNVDEATALLRSQLAGRRVLLLLDNVADVAQVLPLLPGHAGSAAIITSRGSLANLHGARHILLDALSESESVDLLAGVVGQNRVAAEPDATRVLASYSGRLPLAIRLVAGRLATRPTWPIQHFVELLQDEGRRLDSLGSDETGVRASIASSVQFLETSDRDLDRQAAAALPWLAIPDGSDITTGVAAALLELPLRRANAIVERLVDLNLLESVAPTRYRFHDLIRAYGREVANQTLSQFEREKGLARVLRLYAEAAWICQSLTHPANPRLPLGTVGSSGLLPTFSSREASLRWLDAEQRNLMDRFRQARQTSLASSVLLAELSLALFGYHESRRRWQEMRELGAGAIELAQRHDRPGTAAWLQHDGAIPDAESGAVGAAVAQIQIALEMFSEVDDLFGQARCTSSLAYLLGLEGQIEDALAYGRIALALSRTIQDPTLEGVSLTAVGGLYDRTGDFAAADEAFAEGIALAERANDTRGIFKRYLNAAFVHVQVGRYQDAERMAGRALYVVEQAGDSTFQAESHHLLAIAHAAQGKFSTAAAHIEAGLQTARVSRDVEREGRLYVELARITAARGDRSTAAEQLNAALTALRNGSEVYYKDARELLEKLHRGEIDSYEIVAYVI